MKPWLSATLLASLMGASAGAWAQTVGVRWSTPVYAGPSTSYPTVSYVGAGAFVTLNGCLSDYAWCEINDGLNRGWVDPENLAVYQNSVPYAFYDATPWFNYPIVSFVLGDYWGRYYLNQPWYGERYRYDRWDWRQGNRGWHRPPRGDGRPSGSRPERPDFRPPNRPDHQGPGFPGRPPMDPRRPPQGLSDSDRRPTPFGPGYTRPNPGSRPAYQRNEGSRPLPPPGERGEGRPTRPTPGQGIGGPRSQER